MIKTEEFEHLANLARIHLDEKDKSSLIKEFDSILTYIDALKKVSVSMDAEGRVGAVKNIMRDDVAISVDENARKALIDEAPDNVGDFIAVKKIIEQ
jgi:aspartyl/glutamyl-tRNA(Asn/Gln) amidotransferase C subunit